MRYSSGITDGKEKTRIALVRTDNRQQGIDKAVSLLNTNPVRDKSVLLKPNFNTSDPFPGSTHNDTLISLIKKLSAMGVREITIGERSGPSDTSAVLAQKGIYRLCEELGAKLLNFEELPPEDWTLIDRKGNHWRHGFLAAKPAVNTDCLVTTCCLKTHGFGGVFTMSLKLSVGMVHKKNMAELHMSIRSMRKMIAEINIAFDPVLIVMDAIEAFVDGGPMTGKTKRADLIIAGTDRIAIDAVGLAVLKDLGSNRSIMSKDIFEHDQISRAVELGLGISGPGQIELVTDDPASRECADRLSGILLGQ